MLEEEERSSLYALSEGEEYVVTSSANDDCSFVDTKMREVTMMMMITPLRGPRQLDKQILLVPLSV